MITEQQVQDLVTAISGEILGVGQKLLSYSLSSLVTALTIGVYLVLVPILVFFLLQDKDKILAWFGRFLPTERSLTNEVWAEVDAQIGNYARGKTWEILIVGCVTFVVFKFFGLQFSLLLSVVTGFSVLIPYVGAFVVALPVAGVAFVQFGLQPDFYWVDRRLRHHPVPRRQRPRAAIVQRSRQSAPGRDHRRHPLVPAVCGDSGVCSLRFPWRR